MKTRTTWLSGVLVAFGLGIFTTGALLAQTKTAVDVRNFEVLAVDGNNLVVRDERGQTYTSCRTTFVSWSTVSRWPRRS